MNGRLPWWRVIGGFGVLLSLLGVLGALAPVYFENYELTRYIHTLADDPHVATVPDETLRSEVVDRAHRLSLPVLPDEVKISHPGGKLNLQMKYVVQMSVALYQVDLHFHPEVNGR